MTYVSTHISNKYTIDLAMRNLLDYYKLHAKLNNFVFIFHINLSIIFSFLLLHICFTHTGWYDSS